MQGIWRKVAHFVFQSEADMRRDEEMEDPGKKTHRTCKVGALSRRRADVATGSKEA